MSFVEELKNIIKKYRESELDFSLDENHILKWLNQFDDRVRDIVLKETVYVFRTNYFTQKDVDEFLIAMIQYLADKIEICPEREVFNRYVFSTIQGKGNSQSKMIKHLSEYAQNENAELQTVPAEKYKKFVYVDDGIYSGGRAVEDLTALLSTIPNGSEVYVFHFIATSFGTDETMKKIAYLAEHKDIHIDFLAWKKICNYRKPIITTTYSAGDTEEYHPYLCLWPEKSVTKNDEVINFIEEVRKTYPNQQFEFRSYPWNMQAGLFTSVENRRIVEEAFLLKGIYIYQFCDKTKRKYPLGGGNLRTFGTGSFCAFDDNISNTCPLVLWWGNVRKKGNQMDNWHPLLPRRTNDVYEVSAF